MSSSVFRRKSLTKIAESFAPVVPLLWINFTPPFYYCVEAPLIIGPVHKVNLIEDDPQSPETSLLCKSSNLAEALGVTKFIAIIVINLLRSDLGVQQTLLSV